MLLIDHDQSQVRKWREQCGPRSDHHIHFSCFHPLHLIIAFSLRHAGMKDRNPVSKSSIKPHDRLIGQRDLRNQHNSLFSLFQDPADHFHINFCLAASGDAIYQISTGPSLFVILPEGLYCFLLLPGQRDTSFSFAAAGMGFLNICSVRISMTPCSSSALMTAAVTCSFFVSNS